MHVNETDFVDQLLRASLAGYAAEQPRAGLEQRILTRLAEKPESPAWWTWRWLPVGALALAAMLAAALLLFPGRETTRVAPPPSAAPPDVTSAPSPAAPAVASAHPATPRAGAPRTTVAPARAAQFPTPGSLTEEERLLMRYLEASPREVLVASVRSEGPLLDLQVQDVKVPILELKPLPVQSGEAKEN